MWDEYASVALNLINSGFYDGLFEAVEDLLKCDNVFMVLDAPSGSGKTLCGISLLLVCLSMKDSPYFSSSKQLQLLERRIELTVVHCIWPGAEKSQPIYKLIINEQSRIGIDAKIIFQRAKYLDMAKLSYEANDADIDKHVWCVVMQYIFQDPDEILETDEERFNVKEFRARKNLTKKIVFVYVDEVPIKPHEVKVIASLRDAVKRATGVAIALAGTNSKAANMIGLTEASSVNVNIIPWALFMTRLPCFQMSASHLKEKWEQTKTLIGKHRSDLNCAVNAIECSLHNRGNPRLISSAISALASKVKDSNSTFDAWQRQFASDVTETKFPFKTYSGIFPEMNGQLNLLMEASAEAELSDTMLAKHFAVRAVPDNGSKTGTDSSARLVDCAGWLYLATAADRCLGKSLFYVNERLIQNTRRSADVSVNFAWQKTVFAPVKSDILLYLGTCRDGGFFDPACSISPFPTHQVVSSCWKSNVAGSVNFQNPHAENNPGTKLEVTVTAAVCNAAAVKGSKGFFSDYLFCLALELGVKANLDVLSKFQMDDSFKFTVPRFLLPGTKLNCDMSNLIGLVTRMKNEDEFDVLLSWPCQESVRVEVKDRRKVGNGDFWTVATKLFSSRTRIGLLIVHQCCNYWGKAKKGGKDNAQINRNKVQRFLENLSGEKLGMVYFLKADGTLETLLLGNSAWRMVLIQAI